MRALVLTHGAAWGGTEINTLGAVQALAADGHEVILAQCGSDVYDRFAPSVDGYTSVQLALPQPFSKLSLWWWLSTLRRFRPDVCVLAKGWFEMRSVALDVAARTVARRYVVLEHHPPQPPPVRSSRKHFGGLVPGLGLWYWREQLPLRFHTRVAHRVVTDSDHVSDVLCTHYGLRREKVHLVHPGVDTTIFQSRLDARSRLRAEWKIPEEALVLGTVSRLAGVKRLDRMVSAFAKLHAARPELDARLVIAGEGRERDALASLASQLGVQHLVSMPGFVESSADALSTLDVYLMTSSAEGFGIALIEAMACERVCVAIDSGGPADILGDPSLGWLTPPDDQQRFEEAVFAAAALSATERVALGARARAHVATHFERRVQSHRIARIIASS